MQKTFPLFGRSSPHTIILLLTVMMKTISWKKKVYCYCEIETYSKCILSSFIELISVKEENVQRKCTVLCSLLRRFVGFFVASRVLVVYLRNSASVLSRSCCAGCLSHFDFGWSVLCWSFCCISWMHCLWCSRATEASNRAFSQRVLSSLFIYSLHIWCICNPGGSIFCNFVCLQLL